MYYDGWMSDDIQPVRPIKRIGITIAFTAILMSLYMVIGWFQPSTVTLHTVPTPIDDWVSFSLLWFPLYIFMLPLSWAPACTFADWRDFRRWVVSAVLLYLPAVPLWYFWPVTVPREPVPIDGYWTFGLWLLRISDPPVNCLPSMHVAVATLAGLVIRRVDPVVGRRILLLMPFIWYSTMALDQHWFVDGLVGMLFAWGVEEWTHRRMPRPVHAQAFIDRRWHWAWMSVFVVALIGTWLYWTFVFSTDQLPSLSAA